MKTLNVVALAINIVASIAGCKSEPMPLAQNDFIWTSINLQHVVVQPTVQPVISYSSEFFQTMFELYASPPEGSAALINVAYKATKSIDNRGHVEFKLTFDFPLTYRYIVGDPFHLTLGVHGQPWSHSSFLYTPIPQIIGLPSLYSVAKVGYNGANNKLKLDIHQNDQRNVLSAQYFANEFIFRVQTVNNNGITLSDDVVILDHCQNWLSTGGTDILGVELIFSMPSDLPNVPHCFTILRRIGADWIWTSDPFMLPHYEAAQPRQNAPAGHFNALRHEQEAGDLNFPQPSPPPQQINNVPNNNYKYNEGPGYVPPPPLFTLAPASQMHDDGHPSTGYDQPQSAAETWEGADTSTSSTTTTTPTATATQQPSRPPTAEYHHVEWRQGADTSTSSTTTTTTTATATQQPPRPPTAADDAVELRRSELKEEIELLDARIEQLQKQLAN